MHEQRGDFQWPAGKCAAVSLSFDDARLSQADRGLPILDAHGVKATFYVTPANVELRVDAWRRAVAGGHEIGNHTLSHPCSANFVWARANALEDYTLDRMDAELAAGSARVEELVGITPQTFAYPCGQKFVGRGTDARSYVPLVAQRFIAGRGFRDEGPNDPAFCDLAQLTGVDGDELSFAQYKVWVDLAVQEGRWLIFAAHEVGDSGRQTVLADALAELCRYCKDPEQGVWIDTVLEIGTYVRQFHDTGPAEAAKQ